MKKYILLTLAALSLTIAPLATHAEDQHSTGIDFELVEESTETTDSTGTSDTTDISSDSTDNSRPNLPNAGGGTGIGAGSGTTTKPGGKLPSTGEIASFSTAFIGTILVGAAVVLLISRKKGANK